MAKIIKKRRRKRQDQPIRIEFTRLKRWIAGLFGFFLTMVFLKSAYAEEILWQRSDTGIDETRITAISVITDASKVIYAGGGRGIYKSVDSGESWYRVFMLKGEREGINFITYDPQDSYKIFAATGDGLYTSDDNGGAWKRSFRGREDLQREVTCVAIDKDHNIAAGA